MSRDEVALVPGWNTVITDKCAQHDFQVIARYLLGEEQQMLLLDRWVDLEFEDCESYLIFSFRTNDSELAAMLRNNDSWVYGHSGVKDLQNEYAGWFELSPHSVDAETRAWIEKKYGRKRR